MLENYRLHNDLNKNKLFLLTPPLELDSVGLPKLPKNWLRKLAILCSDDQATQSQYKHLLETKHIPKSALQSELSKTVQLIYYRLNGDFDEKLGALTPDNRKAIICALTEDIDKCTPGFHNRANRILFSLQKPQSMDHLLYTSTKILSGQRSIYP